MKQKNLSDVVTRDFLETKLEKLDQNFREYRDQILNKLDEVMGELSTMREENTIGTHQISESGRFNNLPSSNRG